MLKQLKEDCTISHQPGTFFLLGSCIVGLAGWVAGVRRKHRKQISIALSDMRTWQLIWLIRTCVAIIGSDKKLGKIGLWGWQGLPRKPSWCLEEKGLSWDQSRTLFSEFKSNELPRSKLRGIGGIGTIIMPPHPALSREGRGNMFTPKRSYEECIDWRLRAENNYFFLRCSILRFMVSGINGFYVAF